MSFNFKWPTFSAEFHADAARMLDGALNRGQKPKVIADDIRVRELGMGTIPPELEILEIGDLSTDRFRGIFRLTYAGDAHLVLSTKVQANPLAPSSRPDTSLGIFPESDRGILFAAAPLIVPMQLRLSAVRLRAIVVLVVSRQKGITLVFKNDPLESVDVSSTFDSVAVIQKYLQSEIEGQLREMFREDLPGIIHRLSQKWLSGESKRVSGEVGKEDGGGGGASAPTATAQGPATFSTVKAQQGNPLDSERVDADVREAPVPRSTSDPHALARETSSPARRGAALPANASSKKRSESRSRVSTQNAATTIAAGTSPPKSARASGRRGVRGHNAKAASTSAAPIGGELTRDGSEPAWRFAFGTDSVTAADASPRTKVSTGSMYGLEEEGQMAYDPTYGLRPDALRAPVGSTYSGLARLANFGKGGLRDLARGPNSDAGDASSAGARELKAQRSTGVGLEWTGNSYSPDASSVLARAAHNDLEEEAEEESRRDDLVEEAQEGSSSPASDIQELDNLELEDMDDVLEAEDEMPHGPDSESEGSAEVDPIEEARGVDPERFGYPRPRSENAFENSAKPRRPASLFARALQTSSPSGTLRGSMRPASAAGGKRSNSVRSHSMRGRPPRESGSAKTNRTSNFTLGDASISSQQPRVFHSASQIQPPEVSDEDPYEDPEDREARLAAQIADRARSLKTVSAAPSSTVKGGAGGGGRAGSIRTLKGATSRSNIGSPAVEPTREADWFGSTRSRLRMPPTSPWAEDEVGSDSYVGDDLKAEGQGQEAQSELELLSEREDSAHLPRSASNNSLSGGEGSLATLEPEPMDPRSNTYKSHVYRHRIGGVYRPGYGSETASVSGSYSGTSDSRSRSSAWNRSSNVSQSGWGVAPSLSTAPTSTHPTGNMSNEHVGDVSHGSTIRGVSSLNAAGAGGRRSPAGPPGHRMTIDASRHLADLVTSNHTLSPYTRTLDTRGFTVRSAPVTPGGSGSSTPVTGASSAAHAGTAPLSMQQVQSQRLARMGSYDSQSDSHDAAAAAQRPGPPRRRRTFKLGASTQDAPHASDAKVALSDQRRSSYPAQDARSTASAPQTAAQARPNWQRSESGNSTRLASPAMQMQEDGNRPGLDRHRSFRPPSEAARAAASRWTAIRE